MTKEDKDILLKDLCARLPYGVKARVLGWDEEREEEVYIPLKIYSIDADGYVHFESNDYDVNYLSVDNIKPYLRSMSSMTEEEFKEYDKATDLDVVDSSETLRENLKAKTRVRISKWYHGTDWLNFHHFDYRGLIEKGLAIEAPEDMYK